jgi:hypothetical protein
VVSTPALHRTQYGASVRPAKIMQGYSTNDKQKVQSMSLIFVKSVFGVYNAASSQGAA